MVWKLQSEFSESFVIVNFKIGDHKHGGQIIKISRRFDSPRFCEIVCVVLYGIYITDKKSRKLLVTYVAGDNLVAFYHKSFGIGKLRKRKSAGFRKYQISRDHKGKIR